VRVQVTDCRHALEGVIAHRAKVETGTLELDREVEAEVAEDRRRAIARAHTATHLLHHALREVLGSHVAQAGSLVEPDRLRFDFSHFAAVTDEQLAEVSALVTRRILENAAVGTRVTTVDEAKQAGAIALFGEKYGAEVRMVQIGEFSRELCGGTHVDQVAAAGLVLITRESSVGAGLRRIEAVTGLQAAALAVDDLNALTSAAQLLRAPKDALLDRVGELLREVHTLKRDLASARQRRASTSLDDFLGQAVTVNDMRVIAARAPELDADGLRTLADSLLDRLGSGVVVLGSVAGEKVLLVSKVSKDLVPRGAHAGNLVREVAKATGGNGGGRPDFAQAGGRDPEKLDDALALVPTLLAGS
jgi:alanyl-tRNA synthetase